MTYYQGIRQSPLFGVWKTMRQRCLNPRNVKYPRYGGRGITICSEWDQFALFYRWAYDNGYEPGLTIERVDNDGPYSPENCKLVPPEEQARNRGNTLKLPDGRFAKEVAKENGIKWQTVRNRIHLSGWSVADACTLPVSR